MRATKIIGIAVCLVLTAISVNAQRQRYELKEALVIPGFYLAPNGYEYQLPQYGLAITIPPQSYYRVPYLFKHNAYLITTDSTVTYCLYKFYLNNIYTDFALYGSNARNMRYKVAELKNNHRQEFLDEVKKKKDYKSQRPLRTPFATFAHYTALDDTGKNEIHGYYYLSDSILIEFLVTPKDQKELSKYERIIKTLRKADLQEELDEYLAMLTTLPSTVPNEIEEEEDEAVVDKLNELYAQELSTPAIALQPSSPFAEPIPKNTAVTKDTLLAVAVAKSSNANAQLEEDVVEAVAVKIAEAKELVVFKDGYVKPPEVKWAFDVQLSQIPSSNLIKNQQKAINTIESSLLAIYPVVKRPDVSVNIDAPQPVVMLAGSSGNLNTSTAVVEKTLISTIAPVIKKPEVAVEIDKVESAPIAAAPYKNHTADVTEAEKALLAMVPVEKRPEVAIEVDEIGVVPILAASSKNFITAATSAEEALSVTPIEKRPEVSVDINISKTAILPATNTNLNVSAEAAEKILASTITEVVRQPEVTVDIEEVKHSGLMVNTSDNRLLAASTKAEQSLAITPIEKRSVPVIVKEETTSVVAASVNEAEKEEVKVQNTQPAGATPAFVVTGEYAEDFWNKADGTNANPTTERQPKLVDLTSSSVEMSQRSAKKPVKSTIVTDVTYQDFAAETPQREVVDFKVTHAVNDKTVALLPAKAVEDEAMVKAVSQEQQKSEISKKRERCSRFEAEIVLPKTEEETIPYSRVQHKPTFNGGDYNDFALWIGDNMCYPEGLRQELNGFVTVELTIGSNGSIGNINVMSSPHKLLETEVLHMLSTSPEWTPGMRDGKPVAVSIVVGIPVSAYL